MITGSHTLFLGILWCAIAAGASAAPAADLIIYDAQVWPGTAVKAAAEALPICGERIVAVGTSDEIAAWRGPRTKLVDARGRRVLPGFNDAHVHLISGGQQLENVDLRDADSAEEFKRRVAAQAAKLKP